MIFLYVTKRMQSFRIPEALLMVGMSLVCPMESPANPSACVFSERPSPSSPAARPSLDKLLSRANSYWELLAKGRKEKALEYVAPESRENFLSRQTPPFSEPKIIGLEMTARPEEVNVTVEIKRTLQMLTSASVAWKVTEKWVFQKNKWFVAIEKTSKIFSAEPGAESEPALPPSEVVKRQDLIRKSLHFATGSYDFGTVRKGETVEFNLSYRLSGNQAYEVRFTGVPSGLLISGAEDRKLHPGNDQKLLMKLNTRRRQNELDEKFTIVVRHQEAEVSYDFRVHGFVYTPVSVEPMDLKFPAGESEKELVLINNSQTGAIVKHSFSQNGGFQVIGLPCSLAPGASCRLKVKVLLRTPEKNYRDVLALVFDKPVENLKSLTVPVVVNYEEVKVKSTLDILKSLSKKPNGN